jgi:hypothetical protein
MGAQADEADFLGGRHPQLYVRHATLWSAASRGARSPTPNGDSTEVRRITCRGAWVRTRPHRALGSGAPLPQVLG